MPRNATYKPKSAPKSKAIAANCCCSPHPNVRHTPPPATRGIAAIRKPRAATKAIIIHFRGIRNKHLIVAFGAQQVTDRHGRHRLGLAECWNQARQSHVGKLGKHQGIDIAERQFAKPAELAAHIIHNIAHASTLVRSRLRTHATTRIPTCSRARPRTPTLKPTQPRTVGYVRTQVANTHLEHASQTQRTQVARTSNACESNL